MVGAGIEKCRGRMSEVALGHKIISLDSGVNVAAVNAHSNAHQHLLRTLSDLAIEAQ